MKRHRLILFFIAVFAIMPTRAFPSYAEASSFAKASEDRSEGKYYQADVEDISGGKYFPAVQKAIGEARESIYMVMFKVGLRPYDKESSAYKLVEELVKAHERGVKVKVVLDQNIPFIGKEDVDDWEIEGKNAWCYKRLKKTGIDVGYDDATKYTHAKALVIDEETVILGSSNWTESALHKNFETDVLIKSKELAQELLGEIEKIKIEPAGRGIETIEAPVPVSWKFMEEPKLAGRMMSKHDERAFDLYLLILRDYDGNKDGKVILDYDKIARSLGLYDKMGRTGYRRQIIRIARTLQDRYGLIAFEPDYGEDAAIYLKDYDNPKEAYSYPREWYFEIPGSYWEYGWDKKLSMRAKFCYLINLAYASISDARPWWFASREVLSKRFNVGIWMISKGMQELRRQNLIDVAYDELGQNPSKGRLAKSYKVLPLYDPKDLEKEWDGLNLKYGEGKVRSARKFAEIVFEENTPEIIEDIIKEAERLGEDKVKKAFGIAEKQNIDNPKRCYQYVKGILRNDRSEIK